MTGELVYDDFGRLVGKVEHLSDGTTRRIEVVYSDEGRPTHTRVI